MCVEAGSIHLHHAPLSSHKEEGNEAGISSIQLAHIHQAGQMVRWYLVLFWAGSPEKIRVENIEGIGGAEASRAFSAALQRHRGESLLFLLREDRTPISPAPTGCYWKCNSILQSFVLRVFFPHQHAELRVDRCAVLFSDNRQQRSSRR